MTFRHFLMNTSSWMTINVVTPLPSRRTLYRAIINAGANLGLKPEIDTDQWYGFDEIQSGS